MLAFSKLLHADFVYSQKDKLPLCSQAFFCLNQVPNAYSTTPVEVLLELLLLTRDPSFLFLKIYGKANFLKMFIAVDHDNLRTVLLQTSNNTLVDSNYRNHQYISAFFFAIAVTLLPL